MSDAILARRSRAAAGRLGDARSTVTLRRGGFALRNAGIIPCRGTAGCASLAPAA